MKQISIVLVDDQDHIAARLGQRRTRPVEPAALKTLAAEAGLNAEAAEHAWNNPMWKERLKRANEEAIAAGVFGAPYFVIDGEPFWGNDRKPQLEQWLSTGPF